MQQDLRSRGDRRWQATHRSRDRSISGDFAGPKLNSKIDLRDLVARGEFHNLSVQVRLGQDPFGECLKIETPELDIPDRSYIRGLVIAVTQNDSGGPQQFAELGKRQPSAKPLFGQLLHQDRSARDERGGLTGAALHSGLTVQTRTANRDSRCVHIRLEFITLRKPSDDIGLWIDRSDSNHQWLGRRISDPGRDSRTIQISGRRDGDDPQIFQRLEFVVEIGAGHLARKIVRRERQIDGRDVIGRGVRDRPLQRLLQRLFAGLARAASSPIGKHFQMDNARAGGNAQEVGITSGGNSRDMSSMPISIRSGIIPRHETLMKHDAVRDPIVVGIGTKGRMVQVDARVDDDNRRGSPINPQETTVAFERWQIRQSLGGCACRVVRSNGRITEPCRFGRSQMHSQLIRQIGDFIEEFPELADGDSCSCRINIDQFRVRKNGQRARPRH